MRTPVYRLVVAVIRFSVSNNILIGQTLFGTEIQLNPGSEHQFTSLLCRRENAAPYHK